MHFRCSRLRPGVEETRGPNLASKTDVESARPPLKHRAPGSQNCRHPRRPRCSGNQSVTHPLCEACQGRNKGSIRGITSLSFDGSQPESCSGCLDPCDGSTRSVASYRLTPRAKRKTGCSCHVLYTNQFKKT
jgi:hypothetical protein